MERLSILRLSELTGKPREFVRKRLGGVPPVEGTKGAKLYLANVALERIYIGDKTGIEEGESVTEAESRRRLNDKRLEEIELNMEIKRKERIPLGVCEEINDGVFSNMAGLIKAQESKLGSEWVNDMLAELRRVGQELLKFSKAHNE